MTGVKRRPPGSAPSMRRRLAWITPEDTDTSGRPRLAGYGPGYILALAGIAQDTLYHWEKDRGLNLGDPASIVALAVRYRVSPLLADVLLVGLGRDPVHTGLGRDDVGTLLEDALEGLGRSIHWHAVGRGEGQEMSWLKAHAFVRPDLEVGRLSSDRSSLVRSLGAYACGRQAPGWGDYEHHAFDAELHADIEYCERCCASLEPVLFSHTNA